MMRKKDKKDFEGDKSGIWRRIMRERLQLAVCINVAAVLKR